MRVAVFAGPSLPSEDRPERPDLTYLAPASRHDVLAAAKAYDVVLLIDGVFHHDLAPSPKECYASTQHARMFGASSMGALRAAECAPYGFTPLGAIARWYSAGTIDGDDEVAVLTRPQTFDALTVPMVNVRYAARLAERRGILSRAAHDSLIDSARSIFYMDRTWQDVYECVPASARDSFAQIAQREGDLKRWDARFALRSVLRFIAQRKGVPHTHATSPTVRALAAYDPVDSSPIVLPPSVPKAPGTYDRAVPFEKTLAILPRLRERYGITRVADTTYLDRTGIPTYSALVPHSADLLGVYNGKGMTADAAIASAVMEATERQIGSAVHLPVFRESLRVVGERLDLEACGLRLDARDLVVDCVLGTELLTGDAIPVPVAMVQCPWFGERLFDTTTTNGLASGNNLTEAIYHALCELIERHVWCMFHVKCSVVPRFFMGPGAKDLALAPEIEFPTGVASIDGLVSAIRSAGLTVRALALEEKPLPVTVIATVSEPGSTPPMAHIGLGCALSPAHALTRALTECVQSRVVDIQAAREDILRVGEEAGISGSHARRLESLPKDAWYFDMAATKTRLGDLADRTTDDLAADLRATLRALADDNVQSVVAVDLSPADLPVSVVRAIVPGMEQVILTGKLGPRARRLLNPFALR
ncbi:MAG: YcaO-like family protein [Candidatus Eremiobacteraeota bacterium]|nr:YcaO-like family protein [Candidatus Eremiobacteraeota bacterium]